MCKKPQILKTTELGRSRLFTIEQLALKFSNGEQRLFERCHGTVQQRLAVMMVPFLDEDTVILVREYAAGLDRYELTFPKGLVDPGESCEVAVNRELKEEAGYGAKQISFLQQISISPSYMSGQMQLYIAADLYLESLPGDEPEPLEILAWPICDYQALLAREDFTGAVNIAALYLALQRRHCHFIF